MARLIDFGQPHGVVEFPDDATDEQIVARYDSLQAPTSTPVRTADLSASDYAKQAAGSFIRGAGNTIAAIPEGLATAREAIPAMLPEWAQRGYEAIRPNVDPLWQIDALSNLTGGIIPSSRQLLRGTGSLVRSGAEAISPEPVKELESSFLATGLPRGIGSSLAFLAGGVAGSALKIPAWLSIGLMGSAASGQDFYQDAKNSGADERTAQISSLIGNVVGTTEALPLANMIRRLDRVSGNTFSRALVDAGKETFEEALQEATQQFAQNVTAQQLYDQDRGLFDNVAANAGVGGATGTLLSLLSSALGAGRNRLRQTGQTQTGERITDATATGTQTQTPSGQAQELEQGAQEPVRVRNLEGNRLEAQTGTPVGIPQIVQEITSSWENAPPIRIVATPAEIPANAKADAVAAGVDLNTIQGGTDPDGTIWLVANNIATPERARQVLLHEAVGHVGVRGIITDPAAFEEFMRGVAQRHAETELGQQIRSIYGQNEITVGEEIIARLAETPDADPNLWQQIVAAVRGWVRQVFKIEVSDNDIRNLLSKSRRQIESGRTFRTGLQAQEETGSTRFTGQNRVPIQIQQADGTLLDGEFNGYYDLRDLGKGIVPSVGVRLPNGSMTHTPLAEGQRIIGNVPTFEQWQASGGARGGTRFAIPDNLKSALQITTNKLEAQLGREQPIKQDNLSALTSGKPLWHETSLQNAYGIMRGDFRPFKQSWTQFYASDNPDLALGQSGAGVLFEIDPERVNGWINPKPGTSERTGFEYWIDKSVQRFIRSVTFKTRRQLEAFQERFPNSFDYSNPEQTERGLKVGRPGETRFAISQQPQFFRTREQVQLATANPGLTPDQVIEAEELAKVQASMSPDSIVGWIMGSPADDAEARAQHWLSYIEDRRHLNPVQRPLGSLPEGTTEEQRLKDLASGLILGHYGMDRAVEQAINKELEADQPLMAAAVAKVGKLTQAQLKANFLEALFKNLVTSYRAYLANRAAAAPAAENLQAQWREALGTAERHLNDQVQSPVAVQRALSAIATKIPDSLLVPLAHTNLEIVNWAKQNNVLQGVVGQAVSEWMLTNDGTGYPAMLGYTGLIPDLRVLKDILTKQQEVANDVKAFEQWFRPSGKEGTVSAKQFAENYFKFRTGRDRALAIVAATEKEIGDLDTRIRGNSMARDRLQAMMTSPDYVATVREAVDKADVVVRAIYDSAENRTGLIDRDRSVGLWKLKGPISGEDYTVDLYPSSSQEQENRSNLAAWTAEARQWANDHRTDDPLLADEYDSLSNYVERYLLHPSLDPKQGFTQAPSWRIPFTNIRFNPDPFDAFTSATGAVGYSFLTIRDVLERVGGRPVRQAVSDATTLDNVMRKVEGVNANPQFGYAAQTQAVLKALQSHGWAPDQFARWDEMVSEPVLAASQNRLSPEYNVGDTIVGSGVKLTAEDVKALKLMKQWSDAVLGVAPNTVQERLADLGVSRKAIGNGRFTGPRIAAPWTRNFMVSWNKATTDDTKLKLLKEEPAFRRVVLGYVSEFNPEFSKMNPASSDRSPLFDIYRRLANTEKSGVQSFRNWDEVVDFVANEMVSRGMQPTYAEAKVKAEETLLAEITGFISAFENGVLGYESNEVWGGVPSSVIKVASANNAFTTPRGRLAAPSTFYSYSMASDGRRLNHVGSLRSLLNLKLLQSGYEARAAMEAKKADMENRIQALTRSGATVSKARTQVQGETARERQLGELRYDYQELLTALQSLEKSFKALEDYESSTADYYEHAGVAAWNTVFGTIKSQLLSSPQSIATNFWSGTLLGPALVHWQTGQFGRAVLDVVPAAHMWKTIGRRVAAIVADNPVMSKLLKQHAPLWDSMARMITESAYNWRRIQQIAQDTGMVTPYNLRKVLANKAALKGSAGRLTTDDPHRVAEWANAFFSAPGVRHVAETQKAAFPRLFDNMINYALVTAFEQEVEFLKKLGWRAFRARESAAAQSGVDWKDLSNPDNVLVPGDLGLRTNKGLARYRQLFAPLGSLDAVLRDFYERTKNMTPEQREAEPLMNSDDYAALALQYAAITNVATETNRPYAFKGKGSDGVWRNILGTFMGWSANMIKQFSKALQTHSADPKFFQIASNMIGLATIVMLLSAVGAWNWEIGDELSKLLFGQSSARVQIGNIQELSTALLYWAQGLVNVVPIIGSSIGSLFGVAFTGRGTPFDMASLSPHIGFVADVYNTIKRIKQTGDAILPLADFTKRWMPLSKIVLNRLPVQRGLVDQQNAVRSLNASAPPGTEIKWGKGGGGEMRYGPANDEIQKLISAAYEATAHGGSQAEVSARLQEAIEAYVRAGKSPADAEKAVATALAAKEPVRVLTGREMTPEEERKWVARMTPEQRADYDRAKTAWALLGAATGKNFDMVAGGRTGGGGGGGIPGLPSALPGGTQRRSYLPAPAMTASGAYRRPESILTRTSRIRRGRRQRSVLRTSRQRSPAIRTRRTGIRRRAV